ncbi:MAG: hypothetical protein M1828_001592 [Chrysothrix sp. TS-e1954]|nr:MAG: hypothetical protein M1828_001592 [Chrysothrix sp. TS-e1954]
MSTSTPPSQVDRRKPRYDEQADVGPRGAAEDDGSGSGSPGTPNGLPGIRKSRIQNKDEARRIPSVKSKLARLRPSGGFLINGSDNGGARQTSGRRASQVVKGKERAHTASSIGLRDGRSSRMSARQQLSASPDSSLRSRYGKGISISSQTTAASPRSQGSLRFAASPSPSANRQISEESQGHRQNGNSDAGRPASMDPSQLVRLALNLNESRRMQLSPGQLASMGGPNDRRVSSADHTAAVGNTAFIPEPSPRLRDTVRYSRNEAAHRPATDGTGSVNDAHHLPFPLESDEDFHFTPATLLRAEKARVHLELCYEYRRLLRFLPSLHPSNLQAGDREPRLGRTYNPLQYIRNKKVRARRRDPVDGVAQGWDRPSAVQQWVDEVDTESNNRGYCVDGIASLPDWELYKSLTHERPSVVALKESTGGVAVQPPTKRLRVDWTLSPPDLLADAYWLEDLDHKISIEGHDGNRVFEQINTPERHATRSSARRQTSVSTVASLSDELAGLTSPETNKSSYEMPARDNAKRTTRHQNVQQPPPRESRATKVKRHLFGRTRALSNVSSDLSMSDEEETRGPAFRSKGHDPDTNIGPLERHMNKLMENESRNQSAQNVTSPLASPAESATRRLGVSEESHGPSETQRLEVARAESRKSASLTDPPPKTPRISVEDTEARPDFETNGHAKAPKSAMQEIPRKRRPFNLRQRQKPKHSHHTETTDFALVQPDSTDDEQPKNRSTRSSFEASVYAKLDRGTTRDLQTKDGSPRSSFEQESAAPASPSQTNRRFFKGGRIGEIVRSEKPPILKRDSSNRASLSSIKSTKGDGTLAPEIAKPSHTKDRLSVTSIERPRPRGRGRSVSSNDIKDQNYHIKNLPAFVSSNPHSRVGSIEEGDHITRQQQLRNQQRQRSRIRNLAPISVDTSDVSPTNSSPDITRYNTRETDRGAFETPRARNDRSESRSSPGVRAADQRLNKILRTPGADDVNTADLPPTGLSRLRDASSLQAQSPIPRTNKPPHLVRGEDIFYARALLLATGIKARNLATRPDRIQDPPSQFLVSASLAAGKPPSSLTPRLLREEHVLAAQLLSSHLSATSTTFSRSLGSFQNTTCAALNARIDDLRDRVTTQLTPHVQATVDEADAFVARLTTQHTLDIKRVNDAVDLMSRNRRRRLRWLRKLGFGMLEWALVGLMWGIWVVVVVVRAVRAGLRLVGGVVRWLFWL